MSTNDIVCLGVLAPALAYTIYKTDKGEVLPANFNLALMVIFVLLLVFYTLCYIKKRRGESLQGDAPKSFPAWMKY